MATNNNAVCQRYEDCLILLCQILEDDPDRKKLIYYWYILSQVEASDTTKDVFILDTPQGRFTLDGQASYDKLKWIITKLMYVKYPEEYAKFYYAPEKDQNPLLEEWKWWELDPIVTVDELLQMYEEELSKIEDETIRKKKEEELTEYYDQWLNPDKSIWDDFPDLCEALQKLIEEAMRLVKETEEAEQIRIEEEEEEEKEKAKEEQLKKKEEEQLAKRREMEMRQKQVEEERLAKEKEEEQKRLAREEQERLAREERQKQAEEKMEKIRQERERLSREQAEAEKRHAERIEVAKKRKLIEIEEKEAENEPVTFAENTFIQTEKKRRLEEIGMEEEEAEEEAPKCNLCYSKAVEFPTDVRRAINENLEQFFRAQPTANDEMYRNTWQTRRGEIVANLQQTTNMTDQEINRWIDKFGRRLGEKGPLAGVLATTTCAGHESTIVNHLECLKYFSKAKTNFAELPLVQEHFEFPEMSFMCLTCPYSKEPVTVLELESGAPAFPQVYNPRPRWDDIITHNKHLGPYGLKIGTMVRYMRAQDYSGQYFRPVRYGILFNYDVQGDFREQGLDHQCSDLDNLSGIPGTDSAPTHFLIMPVIPLPPKVNDESNAPYTDIALQSIPIKWTFPLVGPLPAVENVLEATQDIPIPEGGWLEQLQFIENTAPLTTEDVLLARKIYSRLYHISNKSHKEASLLKHYLDQEIEHGPTAEAYKKSNISNEIIFPAAKTSSDIIQEITFGQVPIETLQPAQFYLFTNERNIIELYDDIDSDTLNMVNVFYRVAISFNVFCPQFFKYKKPASNVMTFEKVAKIFDAFANRRENISLIGAFGNAFTFDYVQQVFRIVAGDDWANLLKKPQINASKYPYWDMNFQQLPKDSWIHSVIAARGVCLYNFKPPSRQQKRESNFPPAEKEQRPFVEITPQRLLEITTAGVDFQNIARSDISRDVLIHRPEIIPTPDMLPPIRGYLQEAPPERYIPHLYPREQILRRYGVPGQPPPKRPAVAPPKRVAPVRGRGYVLGGGQPPVNQYGMEPGGVAIREARSEFVYRGRDLEQDLANALVRNKSGGAKYINTLEEANQIIDATRDYYFLPVPNPDDLDAPVQFGVVRNLNPILVPGVMFHQPGAYDPGKQINFNLLKPAMVKANYNNPDGLATILQRTQTEVYPYIKEADLIPQILLTQWAEFSQIPGQRLITYTASIRKDQVTGQEIYIPITGPIYRLKPMAWNKIPALRMKYNLKPIAKKPPMERVREAAAEAAEQRASEMERERTRGELRESWARNVEAYLQGLSNQQLQQFRLNPALRQIDFNTILETLNKYLQENPRGVDQNKPWEELGNDIRTRINREMLSRLDELLEEQIKQNWAGNLFDHYFPRRREYPRGLTVDMVFNTLNQYLRSNPELSVQNKWDELPEEEQNQLIVDIGQMLSTA